MISTIRNGKGPVVEIGKSHQICVGNILENHNGGSHPLIFMFIITIVTEC